jgi:hypothetical protein
VTAAGPEGRRILLSFQPGWGAPEGKGLFGTDPRVRTLRRVLMSYPETRHILPDGISLDLGADLRLLETVARFLKRQRWLVETVEIR